MSMDALEQIRGDLAGEQRDRTKRTAAVAMACAAVILVIPMLLGARVPTPGSVAAAGLGIAFVLGCLVVAASPRAQLGPLWVRVLLALALLTPLLASAKIFDNPSADWGWLAYKCCAMIVATGVVLGVFCGAALGRTRRRFGGAPTLLAGALAVAPAVGLGLHCRYDSLLDLAHHAAAAGIVVAVFYVILNREPRV